MDSEVASIEFLNHHMDSTFKEIMARHLVLDIEWLEGYSGNNEGHTDFNVRAVARMGDANNKKCNIICLFPPFYPNRIKK